MPHHRSILSGQADIFWGSRRISIPFSFSVGVRPLRSTRNPQGALPGDPGGSCRPFWQPPQAWAEPGEGGCKGGHRRRALNGPPPLPPAMDPSRASKRRALARRAECLAAALDESFKMAAYGREKCSASGGEARSRRRFCRLRAGLPPPTPLSQLRSPIRLCRESAGPILGPIKSPRGGWRSLLCLGRPPRREPRSRGGALVGRARRAFPRREKRHGEGLARPGPLDPITSRTPTRATQGPHLFFPLPPRKIGSCAAHGARYPG